MIKATKQHKYIFSRVPVLNGTWRQMQQTADRNNTAAVTAENIKMLLVMQSPLRARRYEKLLKVASKPLGCK